MTQDRGITILIIEGIVTGIFVAAYVLLTLFNHSSDATVFQSLILVSGGWWFNSVARAKADTNNGKNQTKNGSEPNGDPAANKTIPK